VGYNNQCALVFVDSGGQNFYILDIKDIGRYVQDKKVGRIAADGKATKH
jgi:hypothetical protein